MLYKLGLKLAFHAARGILASVVVKEAVNMIPPEARAKIASGFETLKDKSKEGMIQLLESQAPGMVDDLVKRNGGKELKKEDLAAAMAYVLEQQKTDTGAAAPTANKATAKKKSAPVV